MVDVFVRREGRGYYTRNRVEQILDKGSARDVEKIPRRVLVGHLNQDWRKGKGRDAKPLLKRTFVKIPRSAISEASGQPVAEEE